MMFSSRVVLPTVGAAYRPSWPIDDISQEGRRRWELGVNSFWELDHQILRKRHRISDIRPWHIDVKVAQIRDERYLFSIAGHRTRRMEIEKVTKN